MSTGKVVLGVLAGAAAGALLGVLFAPDKGSATRGKIVRKSQEYTDELGNKFNEFIDGVTHQFEAIRDEAMRIAQGPKSKVQEDGEEVIAGSNRKARHQS